MNGQTIVFGVHPVREALKSGRPVTRLHLLQGRRDPKIEDLIRSARQIGALVHYDSRPALDRLAGTPKHQGVIAITTAHGSVSLDHFLTVIETADSRWPPLFVVLDQVQDPHNLGAVIRTAEASGVHGVIIPKRRSANLTPAVAKVSAGALSHLPIARVDNLRQAMDRLKEAGVWFFGLDANAQKTHWEIDWRLPVALVAGAEDRGLRTLIRDCCHELISLPMRGQVGSLNVSVAIGAVLYEIVRQRSVMSPPGSTSL